MLFSLLYCAVCQLLRSDCGLRVETVIVKSLYVLFFIELSTHRVHLAGATSRPNSAWVTQQARQLAIEDWAP